MNLFLLIFLYVINSSGETNILEIRKKFQEAVSDEKIAMELDQTLKGSEINTPLIQGYFGANKMILAKYLLLPNQKYNSYCAGKILLEEAIGKDPNNIELYYLRYAIQLNSPGFLGYRLNLTNDRKYLINHVGSLKDQDLKVRIISLLIIKGNLNIQEREMLQ